MEAIPLHVRQLCRPHLGVVALIGLRFLLGAAAYAQTPAEGWYLGVDLGAAVAPQLNTLGTDNDVPTNCDQHWPPVSVGGVSLPLPLDHPSCARSQDTWRSSVDIGTGSRMGFGVGYAFPRWRLETGYVWRQHAGGSDVGENVGDKTVEFSYSAERFSAIETGELFASALRVFPLGAMTPYAGLGLGTINASIHYSTAWHRNPDPAALIAHGRHPAAAGTLTAEEETLSDSLWAYRLIAGVDFPLRRQGAYLALEAQYVGVSGELADGDTWDSLRSHASSAAPGGVPVRYTIHTEDLGYWSVGLRLRYFY